VAEGGGLLRPIPVAATAAAGADLTIGVSLSEEHLGGLGASAPRAADEESRVEPGSDEPTAPLARFRDSDRFRAITEWFNSAGEELGTTTDLLDLDDDGPPDLGIPSVEHPPTGLRTLEVRQPSVDALQAAVTRYRLASYPPDLLISLPRTACRTLDFRRADELIELGRRRAAEALDRGIGRPSG